MAVSKNSLNSLNDKITFYIKYFDVNKDRKDVDKLMALWDTMTRLYTRIIPKGDIYSLAMECFQRKYVDELNKVSGKIQAAINHVYLNKAGVHAVGYEDIFSQLDPATLGHVYKDVFMPVEKDIKTMLLSIQTGIVYVLSKYP